jgi:hypothetical protein
MKQRQNRLALESRADSKTKASTATASTPVRTVIDVNKKYRSKQEKNRSVAKKVKSEYFETCNDLAQTMQMGLHLIGTNEKRPIEICNILVQSPKTQPKQ